MSIERWIAGLVAVTCAWGCSRGATGRSSRDAGQDARTGPDAADSATEEAGSSEATANPATTSVTITPLPLWPGFDATIHDYYVRCEAGPNTLAVSMTAAPGSTAAMIKPVATPASRSRTTTVTVNEGNAIVVGITTGAATEQYWIRCLPSDFPLLHVNVNTDAGTPTPGYYLLGDVLQAAGEGGYAMAVDTNGVPVWYQTTSNGLGAVNVDTVTPGTFSFVPNLNPTYASFAGHYELHDLLAGTQAAVESAGIPLDMHELRHLANGDYLVLADPIATGVDLTGLGSFGVGEDMIGCDIQEIDATGAKVWQWTATDHFDPVQDSTWAQTVTVDGKTVVDPFHCNSIDVDPNGNLLVSSRHMDSVFLVSRASGAVLWKMGGATYSKDGAPYLAVKGDPLTSFLRQHDARLLPNGDVSMFDDQTSMSTPARGVIYSVDVAAGTATMVWQYQGTQSSLAMGSFRVLEDGSRVVGWGVGGAPNRAFTEVDVNGNDLLDFEFPDGDASYRAVKISTASFDINLLRATTGAK